MNVDVQDIERRALAGDPLAQVQFAQSLSRHGQRESAEKWLRQAASQGNCDAMLALGQHLLSNPTTVNRAAVEEGRRLIFFAAETGSGAAAHLAAMMHAIDITIPGNFVVAIDYLTRAAEAGHLQAQAELATLACDRRILATIAAQEILAPTIWNELRQVVDLHKLTKAPSPRIVRESPFIAVAEDFVSHETCEWLVRKAAPCLETAQTYNSSTISGGGTVSGRPVAHHSAASPELDLVLLPILQRIAALTRIPMNGMEPTSVLHYESGQEYQPHYDFLDPAVPTFRTQIARTGQRIMTILVYLNDDFEGGETEFPRLGFRYKGRKGDALLFRNVDSQGVPDRRTLHAGLPPTKGEKWLFARACTFKQT